jgi:hypothetical protein
LTAVKTTLIPLGLALAGLVRLTADEPAAPSELPPHLTAAGTVATVGGQPWGYVVWNATDPAWLGAHGISVRRAPAGGAAEPLGVMRVLTDAQAIGPWISRAAALGEDLAECASIAAALHAEWQDPANPLQLPAALADRLSILGQRATAVPEAAAALRQLGNAHPLFRFLSGTAWGGPLGVANGGIVVIELREVTGAAEGGVVGRVSLTAGTASVPVAPGAPVQVPPRFLQVLPPPGEAPLPVPPRSTQTDLGMALRWSVPVPLRRTLLLTRGFHVWRLTPGFTPPGGLTGAALLAAESSHPAQVRRLTRNPAALSKVFSGGAPGEAGPLVTDFDADGATWFVVDDNQRYATGPDPAVVTGTPYAEGATHQYVAAAVDLLGRPGAVSARGSGVAVHTVPPRVPDVLRVENIMKGGGQRLRVVWQPNAPASGAVAATHYLVFRDRVKNTPPAANALDLATHPSGPDSQIYLGAVPQAAAAGVPLTFDDDALIPQPGDFGATYFYTVRAAHAGPLGYVISSPSPPKFGTFRDRVGPVAPGGHGVGDCPRVGIAFEETGPTPEAADPVDVTKEEIVFRLEARRGAADGSGRDVQWVRFLVVNLESPGDWSHLSPTLYFGSGNMVRTDLTLPTGSRGYAIGALAASSSGRISHLASHYVLEVSGGGRYRIKTRVLGAPARAMATDGQTGAEYWRPYFVRDGAPTVQTLSPIGTVSDTLGAPVVGGVGAETSFLVQHQATAGAGWTNAGVALKPAGADRIYFPRVGAGGGAWRAWEIVDPAGSPPPIRCPHRARPPGATDASPVNVVLLMPAGSHEYRIYRRIDDGPLVLLGQDAEKWDASTVQAVMVADVLVPPAGGRLGYYGQVFDEHGNPSPLALLGEKVAALPELPTPMLEPPVSGGTLAAPTMQVRAACPSPGVERLELAIDPPLPGPAPPLTADVHSGSLLFNSVPGGGAGPVDMTVTQIGPSVASQDPAQPMVLDQTATVLPAVQYKVQIRALGPGGQAGDWSAPVLFSWSPPIVAGDAPWPARPLPPVITWHPMIRAFRLTESHFSFHPWRAVDKYPTGQYPVAVRLGRIPLSSPNPRELEVASNWDVRGVRIPMAGGTLVRGYFGVDSAKGFPLAPHDPRLMHQFLAPRLKQYGDVFVADYTQSLLPVVLYRRQAARLVEGVSLATPDADLVQVSAMIRGISWTPDPPQAPTLALFIDPFVSAARLEPDAVPLAADLCLFDNSPVAAGATYQYSLVHFDKNLEPDAVIDAGTLSFPESP